MAVVRAGDTGWARLPINSQLDWKGQLEVEVEMMAGVDVSLRVRRWKEPEVEFVWIISGPARLCTEAGTRPQHQQNTSEELEKHVQMWEMAGEDAWGMQLH